MLETLPELSVGLLTVGVAYYAIHQQVQGERRRVAADRLERRRERLLGLYADWASAVMGLLRLKADMAFDIETGHIIAKLPARDAEREQHHERLYASAKSINAAIGAATREMQRAHFAILIEEGGQLAAIVESITMRSIKVDHEDGQEIRSLTSELRDLLHSKRVAYRPKD